ncbi:peptidoglycan bridge formation glycyltransferase FemA/FemB family protein [Thiospirochaeta perfilievii]|uniref:Peptidoglycan bridge formation glycyltransferase FemA/FemB family protein n=1 Tax=Thiospirochaeta perfilievii TaxID=252967 RepID=A0A5C1QB93_9SPIO|nr:peptidoglycan bridge formation glycyltransferase FemA/FemB family protein [Thiospirochaeta perfilievii]QEN05393.1 peptidoglycan bridge formation glycyltransferase FemA/FemB family protein [Thiospirochaeta perfilievii]
MFTITRYKREELGEQQALFSGSNFMQTLEWADLKALYGFKPNIFVIDNNGVKEGLIVLLRTIFKGLSLAYIPHGPSNKLCNEYGLHRISKVLKHYMPKGTLFIRYDLLLDKNSNNEETLKGLSKSPVTIQVPDTTILDITSDEDVILSAMHKKTRYNIKLAAKKGVVIREVPISELDRWYNMYEVTAKRDSIAIHSKEYYKSVYDKTNMKLLFAEHDGELLAGIFLLIQNDIATYLYGASSNSKRNLMPSYLLQWEAIKLAKELGAKSYDFFGIPPTDDKNHPMFGLYRFKVGFSGQIINRVGCYDYYLSPIAPIFTLIERLRSFYYKRLRKI